VRGLYAIVDIATLRARRLDPIAFAEAILSARPAALQLRAKEATSRATLALLRDLAPMCNRCGVPLVANDRPDLALVAGCDMVHVGQDDMPAESVRQIAPSIGVGISTHTHEQLESALSIAPSYVAFGPVFETSSKRNPDAIVGVAGLRAAHASARSCGVPLVAIGGISYERARAIVELVDAIAVISALLPKITLQDTGAGERHARDRHAGDVHASDASAGNPRVNDVLVEVARRARALQELFAAKTRFEGTR
jgi:thiamine-phosphate pyrophosphorylase